MTAILATPPRREPPGWHWLFLGLLALRFAVPLALTGSIVTPSHDNTDSEVVYSVVIGRFWAAGADPAAFDVFLGGVLGWADFARVLQPLTLFYAVLPPVWAYALTEVALLVLAYAGMLHLLGVLGLAQDGARARLIACLAAFGMSYSSYGAGLAGLPLFLALVFAPGRVRPGAVVLAAFLGLNAAFALHGLFAPVAVAGLALMLGRWPGIGRVLVLCAAYVAASLAAAAGLVMSALAGMPSHRADWPVVWPEAPLVDWATGTLANLLTMGSAYHAVITPALHVPVILIAAAFAGGVARRGALVLAAFTALAVALDVAAPWLALALPGAVSSIQWHRFLLFAPFLALVLAAVVPGHAVRGALALSLGLAMLAGMGLNPAAIRAAVPEAAVQEVRATLRAGDRAGALRRAMQAIAGLDAGDVLRGIETWDRQFRPGPYACLRAALPEGARVLSHGPDPMIAPFHGIAALDGYHNLYPLGYKRAFRPVIAPVLAEDPALAAYFDDWGSRIGTFADRASLPPGVGPDWQAAARLGASHVIADRAIRGLPVAAECDGLTLYRIASGPEAP